MITQAVLKHHLHYNPDTGIFTWRVASGRRRSAGMVAGCYEKDRYVFIGLLGGFYRAHRLAFLYMTGEMPSCVDHVNMDKHDNRWLNLRPATVSQNGANRLKQKNNTSGVKGVLWNPRDNRWLAKLKVGPKNVYLGQYENLEDAKEAQRRGAIKYFGAFARADS